MILILLTILTLIIATIKFICNNNCYLDLGYFNLDEEFKPEDEYYKTAYFYSSFLLYVFILIELVNLLLNNFFTISILISIITYIIIRNKENFLKERKQ